MAFSKIIIKNNVRAYVSDLTEVAQEAVLRHNTSPLPSLALATAIAVFGPFAIIKARGRTSVLLKANGPLKNIIVESDSDGHIRALVGNPDIPTDYDNKDINLIPIKVGVGESGFLRVVHEYEGESFGGEVLLAKGDIVTDLAYYFDQSEQIYTAVLSDVKMKDKQNVERAYSVIFQMLPGYQEEDVEFVENMIKNHKLSTMSLDDYTKLIGGSLVGEKSLAWKCNCSEEKMKNLLNLISEEEQKQIIAEHGFIEVTCNFCNNKYKVKGL